MPKTAATRTVRRLAIAGCAATVVLFLLIGPGGGWPGGGWPAGAGSLTVGAGSTMQLGDALVNMGCNDLIVEPGGRLDAQASTPSAILGQGNVFAFNVSGAGLAAPRQTLVLPACVSVAGCSGTQGEGVSFLRKGATNIFSASLTAPGRRFPAPHAPRMSLSSRRPAPALW